MDLSRSSGRIVAYSEVCRIFAFFRFITTDIKVKLLQLSVAGVEKVTVPVSTFDAYRVEVSSADGGPDKKTVWIAKDSRKVVKMRAVLISMGSSALMTEETID